MIEKDLTEDIFFAGPEAILIEKDANNNIVHKLTLTNGDFDSIIDWIPFNESSDNKSLVYQYKTQIDFGENVFVLITRVEEFYDQLVATTSQVNSFYLPVLDALKQICQSTLQHNNRLFIKFE